MKFFFCYFFPGRAAAFFSSASLPCLHFQHHDRIWEKGKIFDGVRSFPHIFPIFTKPTATPTYPENFARVAISKVCRGRSRNSSLFESQIYFVSERRFFQFHEQQAEFRNEVHHLTRFFEKLATLLPSRLMMLIRHPLKTKQTNERRINKNSPERRFKKSRAFSVFNRTAPLFVVTGSTSYIINI